MSWNQAQYEELIGSWQLVDFDGIKKLKSSAQYLGSSAAFREDMEAKIKFRLENTVYKFLPGDTLAYTDFVKSEIILRKAKVELGEDHILKIYDADQVREAKIVELDENRLVLEPVSSSSNSAGKLYFERKFE